MDHCVTYKGCKVTPIAENTTHVFLNNQSIITFMGLPKLKNLPVLKEVVKYGSKIPFLPETFKATTTVLVGLGAISVVRAIADKTPFEFDDDVMDRVVEVIDMDEELW